MSWLFEDGAEQNAEKVFKKSLKSFLNGDGDLRLIGGICDTVEKQKAMARVIATNIKIEGFSGKLQ